MITSHNLIQNRLLAELAPAEIQLLAPHLELVQLARGDVLYQAHGKMLSVYFPTTATISVDYMLENGDTSEITSIGNEGLLGVSLLMGGVSSTGRAIVQVAGHAYRLSAGQFMEAFYHKGPLLRLLLRYTQTRLTQISQLALCNSHHSTRQRLCRWLLHMLDRSSSNEILVTQEGIAAILGVRREGVTDAVGRLQDLGIIKCRRGNVTVLRRAGLDEHACECYAAVCRATSRLLPDLPSLRSVDQQAPSPDYEKPALSFAVAERRQRAGSAGATVSPTELARIAFV